MLRATPRPSLATTPRAPVQPQLQLFPPPKTPKPRGGKRAGAGRPRTAGRTRSSEKHQRRPKVRASQPVHVVLRCEAAVGRLRKRHVYQAIRWSTVMMAKHEGCRIIHLSNQGTHLHLIIEATDRIRLARGVQAFEISAAQRINRAISAHANTRRTGRVFADRYHVTILTSPRQVRHALAYVLNNWRRHGEDQRRIARRWHMDPFSSGAYFDGWKEREAELFIPPLPEGYQPMVVWFARSWLLTTGWRRHGLISVAEVPKGRAPARRPRA